MDMNTALVLASLVAGAAGIIGTMAGAAIGWWIERGRREREDRHRFIEHKRALYSRLIEYFSQVSSDLDNAVSSGSREYKEQDELDAPIGREMTELVLYAPNTVIAASREVFTGIQLLWALLPDRTAPPTVGDSVDSAQRSLEIAIEGFLGAVRADLGIDRLIPSE